MLQRVFTIFDVKADAYLHPFFMPTVGMAERAFCDLVRDETTKFAQHPEDYTLMSLGDWDDNTGEFTCGAPRALMTGLQATGLSEGED